MQRRTVLMALIAMIPGRRSTRTTNGENLQHSMQQETGWAAAEVAHHCRQSSRASSAIRLCQLLSDRCKKNPPVSPALVQATLDTCIRVRDQLPPAARNVGFLRSVANFQRLAEHLVQTLTA